MAKTSLLKIIYPEEDQNPFWVIFEAMINQIDGFIYPSLENPHLILTGGGTVTLNTGTDTLAWTEDFQLLNTMTGGKITIAAGSLIGFTDGKTAYVTASRPVAGSVTGTLAITDVLGIDTSKIFIALRQGSSVLLRSDQSLKNNFAASSTPSVNNDNSQGYSVGSRWIDTAADSEYVCLDDSVGTAVWKETTAAGGGGSDSWVGVENLDIDIGTEDVDSFSVTSDGSGIWEVFVCNGENIRQHTLKAAWNYSSNDITAKSDDSTIDIGDTTDLVLSLVMIAGDVKLQATAASDNWVVKGKRMSNTL